MKHIEGKGDWGSYSIRLDGKPLVQGEKLRVRWPDGTMQVVTVNACVEHGFVSDMGHDHPTEVEKAWITLNVHGSIAQIDLVDLEAERVLPDEAQVGL